LSIIGRILMLTSGGRSSGRGDSRGGLVLLGLGVFVLGLVGAFFGRLIMAAVSRQREYLADASAVQFTRNSDGIGGGRNRSCGGIGGRLKKDGGVAGGLRHHTPPARGAGPLFFPHPLPGGGPAGPAAPPPPPRRAHPRARPPVRRAVPGGGAGGCRSGRRPPP